MYSLIYKLPIQNYVIFTKKKGTLLMLIYQEITYKPQKKLVPHDIYFFVVLKYKAF